MLQPSAFLYILKKTIDKSIQAGSLKNPLELHHIQQARWRLTSVEPGRGYTYLAFIAGRYIVAHGKRRIDTSRESLVMASITKFVEGNLPGEPTGFERAEDVKNHLDECSWQQALSDFDSCRPNNITDKHIDSLQKPCNWEWVRYDRHRNMVLQVTAHVNGVKTYNITVILARDLTPCRRYRVIRLCFSPSWWQKLRDFFST